MIGFWITGVVTVLSIGVISALIAHWIIGKNHSRLTGFLTVSALCLAYHAIAALVMDTPILCILRFTIIVPFGFGFGEGNASFAFALLLQAILAGIFGMGIYWLMERNK